MISEAQIAAQLGKLPTLPASYYRVVQLSQNEASSAADFEQALKPDPALTANVLRLANSAFFGVQRSISSIRHAVAMLGVRRVVQAALGAAMRNVVPDVLPGYGMESGEFWRHSVAVAACSSRIGEKVGQMARKSGGRLDRSLQDGGLIFTAGLLHDIGKLMVGIFLAENLEAIQTEVRERENVFITAEELVLGIDHTKVGVAVAEKWHLPEAISVAARYHHAPGEAPPEFVRLVDVVHLADCVAHSLGYGVDLGELSRRIDEGAMARLGLANRHLEEAASGVLEEIDELVKTLGKNR
ncbi:MAG: HDOD domain-containing protein [Lentisphaeria bacterium]|nr:HDOD domain-containing protein [Lentisphaeria bacterium]